jgi:hypothetical protein
METTMSHAFRIAIAVSAILLVLSAPAAPAAPAADAVIHLGGRLEPLVDDFLIDRLDGARLVLHHPTPREVAIVHDAPWEGNTSAYHTVFQDGDLYRMYYRGSHSPRDAGGAGTDHPQWVCYAESKDGIRWTKPTLGLFEFDGSKKNNIVWTGAGSHNFAPMKDANPAAPADARYKALGSIEGGLVAFKSPDGIRWSPVSEKPVITKGAFDSQNLAFWDTVCCRYVEYHRGFRDGVRDIMTCTSSDFATWSEPVWIEYPGSPKEHLYTNQIVPYFRAPHVFFGFPKRYVPTRNPMKHHGEGVSDGLFMTSRDGLRFHRWGEALIRPGPQKDRWVNRNNLTAWGIVVTRSDLPGVPDELSIYSTEHYYQGDGTRLRRFSLRVDGFVSVQAPLAGGELVTKVLDFALPKREGQAKPAGGSLVLNYATSAAGSIRCEVQDAAGNPVSGYALADCDEIYGDELDRAVSWKGKTGVAPLAGKPIRLRWVIQDADLYSFQFR